MKSNIKSQKTSYNDNKIMCTKKWNICEISKNCDNILIYVYRDHVHIAWFICDKDVSLSLSTLTYSQGNVRRLVSFHVHVSTQVVVDSTHNYMNVNFYS
jgi:hypothetical protein